MAPADFPWPARIGRNWRSSPRMRPAETHPPRRDEADVRCLGQSPIPSRTSHPECARVEVLPRSTARTKSAETTYIDILERSPISGGWESQFHWKVENKFRRSFLAFLSVTIVFSISHIRQPANGPGHALYPGSKAPES